MVRSVHAIRSEMSEQERAEHDEMWGFDFGDFNDILVVREQKQRPEYLKDHPMCVNSINDYRKFLAENLDQLNTLSSVGLTMLQELAVSGNLSLVKVCLEMGADKNVVSKSGKLAIDYASELGWEEVVKILR